MDAPTSPARPSSPISGEHPGAVPRRLIQLGEGRSIAYAEAGEGPDVVLIHGTLMALEDMWLPLKPVLSPRYRIIAVDRPGHGLSARNRIVDASPWRQAETIREALDAIGVTRPLVIGHSYGGTVALCHALAFPEATAGVLALAPLCFPEMRLEQALFGPRFVPGLGEVLASSLAKGGDPLLLPLLWQAMFKPQTMPAAFATSFPFALASGPERMIAEGEDSMSTWSALTRATLAYGGHQGRVRILGGTADLVVNNAIHGFLAAGLMRNACYDWVPGMGHMLHHFRQDLVAAALDALAGMEPDGGAQDLPAVGSPPLPPGNA